MNKKPDDAKPPNAIIDLKLNIINSNSACSYCKNNGLSNQPICAKCEGFKNFFGKTVIFSN